MSRELLRTLPSRPPHVSADGNPKSRNNGSIQVPGECSPLPVLDVCGERRMRIRINLIAHGSSIGNNSGVMSFVFCICQVWRIVIVEMAADDVKRRPKIYPFLWSVKVVGDHRLHRSSPDLAHGRAHIFLGT